MRAINILCLTEELLLSSFFLTPERLLALYFYVSLFLTPTVPHNPNNNNNNFNLPLPGQDTVLAIFPLY